MRSVNSLMEEKLKSDQQTPANKAAPQMSIQVSRARSTIMDSDYWTVETIRQKIGFHANRQSRMILPLCRIAKVITIFI